MLRKRWQPRRLRASFPPMPSPATSDRRAASYLARLREWRRQDRTSPLHRSGSTRVSSSSSASVSAVPRAAGSPVTTGRTNYRPVPMRGSPHDFFFFNDTATTEIYTLSLHDALPTCPSGTRRIRAWPVTWRSSRSARSAVSWSDRKSTRLNSSHGYISYAVFCLKKKKKQKLNNKKQKKSKKKIRH